MTSKLIYGFHSVISSINANPQQIEIIYVDNKRRDKRQEQLTTLAQLHNITLINVTTIELEHLVKIKSHQGVAAKIAITAKVQPNLKEFLATLDNKVQAQILILDGITDPHNLGAILRTADCFGVDAIILPKNNSANIDNPVVAKTSSGAISNLVIIHVNNIAQTIEILKEHQFWIAGTSIGDRAQSLFEFKCTGKLAWVVGNEGSGMRHLVAENCDYLLTIPTTGKTESLNVSVATGIILAYINFYHTTNKTT